MMMYALLADRLPGKQENLIEKAVRLFNFVKSRQNRDGSWFYYADTEKGNFIDCFHSCFVLKNLIKFGRLANTDVSHIVNSGLGYLLRIFIDSQYNLARRFSISANPSLAKFDLYDQAELLNVLVMARWTALAKMLYGSVMEHFYIPGKGTFGYQIDRFGILNRMTYLRWAVMPMIYALSEYYKMMGFGEL